MFYNTNNAILEILRKLDELNRINPSISEVIDKDTIELPQIIEQQKAGKYFFRAVKLSNLLDLQNWNEKNFRATPEYEISECGRLNAAHESMMYFSNRPEQTLTEIAYDYKTPVVIAAYRVQGHFRSVAIGTDYPHEQISVAAKDEKVKKRLAGIRDLFSRRESPELNKITSALRKQYDLHDANAQAWTFPIVGEVNMSEEGAVGDSGDSRAQVYNLAMCPGLAKQYLKFAGAIVISDANPEGRKHVEFCFDQDYRLDYLKGYPELAAIFDVKNWNRNSFLPAKERLLKKIKADLKQLIAHGSGENVDLSADVFGVTLSKLNALDLASFNADDESIFSDVYRQLLDLQDRRSLNVYEAPLLNDLDELEDYLIR